MSVILLDWTFNNEPRMASNGVFENVEHRIETGLSHVRSFNFEP